MVKKEKERVWLCMYVVSIYIYVYKHEARRVRVH